MHTGAFEQHVELFARLQSANPVRPEITFDDGHISNLSLALPIRRARNIIARFFITVGWTGQRAGYMSWPELRTLHNAGQRIGAHGWSHTLLTHCSAHELDLELNTARKTLEDNLGASVTTISLPGGRFNPRVLAACFEAGYTTVFTSIPKSEPIPPSRTVGRLNIRGDAALPWLRSLLVPHSPTLAAIERQDRLKSVAKSLLGDHLYRKLWSLVNREEEPDASTIST